MRIRLIKLLLSTNDKLLRIADNGRRTTGRLEDALTRIKQGTFGECAQCAGQIEVKRLDAVPWALYCLKCQETPEQR